MEEWEEEEIEQDDQEEVNIGSIISMYSCIISSEDIMWSMIV